MKTDYKIKPLFPLMFRIPGITLFISGIIFICSFNKTSILGVVILLVSIPIIFTKTGILLDFNKNQIKNYIGLFNIKIGKWQLVDNYPFITLLHLNLTSRGESISGLNFTDKYKVYRISLLSENHREKLKIIDFSELNKATIEAEKIAESFNLKFVKYSPK
ncbi:hypothetical protein F6U93_01820 [Tamlana haliotis]|uniref:Uncharacterized protein n=1 Tax=Pseudotamlana haliotis TaxID=2614804 RepID=A0A6N6MHR7_9FLAO|nr:hypothetical protein [Tamlana haliotis]KAB1070523.1 hypothetical protein F6U93_01820 [Tamlana haliotis]